MSSSDDVPLAARATLLVPAHGTYPRALVRCFPDFWNLRVRPEGPVAIDPPLEPELLVAGLPGFWSLPRGDVVGSVVMFARYRGHADPATALGVTATTDIDLRGWFRPDGAARPPSLAERARSSGTASHQQSVGELWALLRLWPASFAAFFECVEFDDDGPPPDGGHQPLTEAELLDLPPALVSSALAAQRQQVALLRDVKI